MLPQRSLCLVLIALLPLAACVDVPELGDTVSPELENADYPKLIPLDESYLPSGDPAAEAERIANTLTWRSNNLRRKAEALRNTSASDDDS